MKDFFTSRFSTIANFLSTQHLSWTDLKNLFSWGYWAEPYPPVISPGYLPSFIALLLIISGLGFWRRRLKNAQKAIPIYQTSINQLANITAFITVVALSYLFFRLQGINYLSSRLVILLSLLVTLCWLGWVGYFQIRIAPPKRREYLERERFFRYIPKSKEKSVTKKQK